MIGLLGFKSPTKDLNVTASLAVMSIVLVEAAGIRKKGVKGWVKSFAEPIPIIAPINVLELFIRPLSLCMRLFGNVLGAVVVMALIKYLLPLVVPLPFSGYFDIFDGVIQAYVFVFLTSLYTKGEIIMSGLIALGAAVAVITGIGAGLGIGMATSKAVDAIARQPEADSKITKALLLGCALAEATAIYGFVIGLLIILFLK